MSYAYKKIKLKDGTTRDEHRLVMERHLSRKLERFEVVHHIDGDKRNNDLSNLELQSLSEHSKHHRVGARMSEAVKEKIRVAALSNRDMSRSEEYRKLREVLDNGGKVRMISRLFGYDRSFMWKLKNRMVWGDI